MREKAAFMKVAIKNGITDLGSIRDRYNFFAEGGSIETEYEGGTLPTVDIVAKRPRQYARLTTYYPGISKYPFTGHSRLTLTPSIQEGNEEAFKFPSNKGIDKSFENEGYNLVTNNCSDATNDCLENIFNKTNNQIMFTTPGDVRDFALEQLGGIPFEKGDSIFSTNLGKYILDKRPERLKKLKRGVDEVFIPMTLNQYNKADKYIRKGNRENIF